MSKRLITNIILAIFTIALFVFEGQWPSGVVILIIYNFYQSYEKLAVQIVEWYFKLFFTFGIIGAPYLILTEGFGYTDEKTAVLYGIISFMILIWFDGKSREKKEEDRTYIEKALNKILEYTIYPLFYAYLWIVLIFLIAGKILAFIF